MKKESKFMELWHNKKTHAAIVLGLWMIFLLIVIIISFVGGNATKNNTSTNNNNNVTPNIEEKVEFRDYELMQKDLLKSNYSYEYVISNADEKVIYKGEKTGVLETGYRETSEETIKYYIDENGLYKVQVDELYAFDKLYENVIEDLIDPNYIFEIINDQSYLTEEVENTRTYTYKYSLEEVDYEVIVKTNNLDILQINIKFADKLYELKYNDINKLENLSYIPKEAN